MDEEEARQFAKDLFHGSKQRTSPKERRDGTDAHIAIVRRNARTIWRRVCRDDK